MMRRWKVLVTALLLLVNLASPAAATITFSIPNTFATQSGPTIPLSQLDANFTALVTALSGLVAATSDLPLIRNYTGSQNFAKGATISDGATITLGSDGNYFQVDGATTVTAISTVQAGALYWLRFNAARTLTHNATTLILCGATNATTAAGDLYAFVSEGGGNWREIWRRPVTSATTANFMRGDCSWNAATTTATSVMMGMNSGASVAGGARYLPVSGMGFSASATVNTYATRMPRAGTLQNLYIKATTAPGVGQSVSYTLMKNGVASALVATVTDANTTAQDTTHTVTLAAGDTIEMEVGLSGGGTPSTNDRWSFEIAQ